MTRSRSISNNKLHALNEEEKIQQDDKDAK